MHADVSCVGKLLRLIGEGGSLLGPHRMAWIWPSAGIAAYPLSYLR